MPAKIYPAARERILEVWDYTEKKWGEQQADAYVRELVSEIETVSAQRHRWRPVLDEALKGVYFFRHRHHYVFFRELTKRRLGVISVLHEKMDLPARLREDAGRE
ncbi:type II toxin-antitoxin system RelE/ParE family toxin [Prosthecobacter vanneervenii]|uniref:Plasmid stabilization system protein ParE n=1 Tax=Prosthecobacter vanneervenii TaxID=48466 RepID=A0A7W7YAW8_9BACT|nr:type II toxin-antitoxin system RelE/ParE family toxin [Prosthecobacter vanneervenii]MBB5032836.1 plasmid stabilization system protein ParE [Prosthecobacter vanneervenii]